MSSRNTWEQHIQDLRNLIDSLQDHKDQREFNLVLDQLKDTTALIMGECSEQLELVETLDEFIDRFPNPAFHEDFSEAQQAVDDLRRKGIEDVRTYLQQHHEVVQRIVASVSIRKVNQAVLDLYDISDHGDFFKTLDELVVPEMYDDIIDQILAIASGEDRFDQEIRNYNELGKIQHLIVTMSVINREKYGLSRVLISITDISELKAAQHQRELLEEQLSQAKKMEALGLLAGGVAHDLNNVLVGIVSYPDMLLMDMREDDPLRPSLELIRDSGQEAANIVQDLLTLARRGVATNEIFNINQVIAELLDSPEAVRLVEAHPYVRICRHLDQELLNIKGSRIHIKKMIMNLLINAYEAQPDGGTISISTANTFREEPFPGVRDRCAGDLIELTISDTGVGIPDEDLGRIFEPFYTKKIMGRSGTGLGMAVVWWAVQDHVGHIEVESSLGKGTTFRIYLPVTDELQNREDILSSLSVLEGNGESILVVDDMDTQRAVAVSILRRLGYHVKDVPSGGAAIDMLHEGYVPDLIMLDMLMPGLDGLDTYERLRDERADVKAIIVSGYAESDRVRKALEMGVRSYLQKPYTLEKLGRVVKGILTG